MHVASLVLTISSGAFDTVSSRCASTNPTLDTQWDPSPSSFSWAFSYPSSLTLSSLASSPVTLMT
ncbi:hypothetical protein BHM03_00036336 [Ensete ventricosum]|nr:hypothetical protein BHM03_00036336 [Ensete ventricosum]